MRVGSSAKIYSWPLSIGKLKDQKQEFKQPTFQGPTQLLDQISPATGIPEARPVESASSPLETIDHSRSPNTGYAFQEDLNIDLPLSILQRFSSQAPQNYNPGGPTKYAYATFMASRNPSPKDPYFLAIHSVIHRILWSPRTRTQKNIPFIVFVADFVTQEQRALFAGAGAVVRELKPLDYHCDSTNFQSRWKDLFTKLNMWAETDFERILFLDADAFPLTNIDAVFDVAPVQDCVEDKLQIDDFLSDRTPVCEPYVFAGVSDNPLDVAHSGINVGSMVFSPSLRMHQRLVQNYLKTDHYDCGMAEQAFLNWQFNTDSAYPSTKLDREWGGYFPKEDEMGRLKVVHEKIWVARDGWTAFEWKKGCVEMVEWYGSAEFMQQRRPL
ncbi:nucleotide-diphospho-sugar transferase [Ophiobolus disseminans]|uniref:Nucleotide-diphospho-sugar transferase n=1 Tax=Ophiobolus disseminans TaxID=1469910 RepID=A0A6A6ZLJ4_9PLEO|nr:nucleotide-diphospho-sugar transferase [Ophiobolus disseminans]